MKSLSNKLAVLSLVLVLALLASSVAANAQIVVTNQKVLALKIERVLQLNNVLTTITPVAAPNILAALAGGALEIREMISLNPIANSVTASVFLVPTGTPFPTPSTLDTFDPAPLGTNVATFILAPDRTYVTKNSVMFSGIIYTSSPTPYGDYTGAPGVISFGLTNDSPPKFTNVVDLISGAVVTWSASATGTITLSQPPVPPVGGGGITVAITPANQQVTSPLAHLTAVATDPNNAGATFTYFWTVNAPPSATIINPFLAAIDVQLGAGFNTYTFTVKATNTATGQSGTATTTVSCVCADHF